MGWEVVEHLFHVSYYTEERVEMQAGKGGMLTDYKKPKGKFVYGWIGW